MGDGLNGDEAFRLVHLLALLLLLAPLALRLSPRIANRMRLAGGALVLVGLAVAVALFGLWLVG